MYNNRENKGLILPTHDGTARDGLTISWHNLSVWIKRKSVDKSAWLRTHYENAKILNNVSGIAEPGALLAIMGPSGAGKTTLLATISQRLKGDVQGRVLVNGQELSKDLMLKVSGFVAQQDISFDALTVMEHMHFMARLKMDKNLTHVQRERRIVATLLELGIGRCAGARLSALAKGEKKRVSLAVQMLTDPGILFCDEPTTGMDSFSASSVVEQLSRLSQRGKTVICTIHQPASGIFDMFHTVYLLVAGGRLALACPTDQASAFFNSLGMVCPKTYNMADFLLSRMALMEDEESYDRINRVCDHFRVSFHYDQLMDKLSKNIPAPSVNNPFKQEEEGFEKYLEIKTPKRMVQLRWLLWRSILVQWRQPQHHVVQLAAYLCLAVLGSLPYTGLQNNQQGIQNMQGILYLIIVETIFTFAYSVAHTFPSEIDIMLREIGNGLYYPDIYYVSKMIVLLPRALIEPIIFAGIVYSIVGLYGGFGLFLKFCLPVIFSSVAATAYGCAISATFETISSGSLVSVPFDQVTILFCGIYMSLSDLPIQLAWLKYISFFYYGIEGVSIVQWTQIDDIPCSEKVNTPCISSGDGVLHNYGYNKGNFGLDLTGLWALYCGFHVLGFLAFLKRSRKQAAY